MSEATISDEQRQRVVVAAKPHFNKHGWQVDVSRVAAEAGVTPQALIGYFGNRGGLALAAYDSELWSLVNATYGDDPHAALAQFVHDLANVLVRRPAVVWALQLHGLYPVPDGLKDSVTDFDQLADHLSGLIAARWRDRHVVGSMTEIAEGYLFALVGYVSKHPNEHGARAATILLDLI